MSHPFSLSGNQVRVTASIGVASAAGDDRADDLLRNADMAMYAAKRHGKGRSATYESRMYADIRERLDLEAALRHAIEANQLTLFYQPIVNLQSGAIYGVEALLRWEHPQFGRLRPSISSARGEDPAHRPARRVGAGRGVPPGARVARSIPICRSRCRSTSQPPAQGGDQRSAPPDAPLVRHRAVGGGAESPESADAADRRGARSGCSTKGLGVRLAIDDFGTGTVAQLPAAVPDDILKIAKPFVEEAGQGADVWRWRGEHRAAGLKRLPSPDDRAEGTIARSSVALLEPRLALGQWRITPGRCCRRPVAIEDRYHGRSGILAVRIRPWPCMSHPGEALEGRASVAPWLRSR
jgi:hypothetical protein